MVVSSRSGRRAQFALVGCLFLVGAGGAGSAPAATEPLPALVAFLKEAHPDPYRFTSEAELEAHLTAQMAELGSDPSPVALARAASRVLAVVGDAHLAVGLPPEVASGPLVPFLLKRAGDRVFLDAAEPALPIGTEVISVEGRPVGELLARMARLASVDGARPTVMAAEAERRFTFLGLLELGVMDVYELVVRRPGGRPETVTLPATNREGVARLTALRHSAPVWGSQAEAGAPAWPSLEMVDAGTALLRLPSFSLNDSSGFADRINALFARLDPEHRLVVDLRGNEGGNRALGVMVLNHLLGSPFTQWRSVSTRVRAIPTGFRDFVSFPFAPAAALHDFPGVRRGDRWVVDGDPLAEQMVPDGAGHQGPILVFVDDATNSAAIEFLAGLLAHRADVRIIGTETQGACDRHFGQLPVVFEAGDLAVMVSLFDIDLVAVADCQPGRGIVPHTRVAYTEQDFLRRRDPYLAVLTGDT